MLELNHVNKYFNKGKKNQVHVIDNTSIKLESHGLVALLGPSGCGKTTLLNTIGGLDKVKSGSIYINGKKINSIFSHKVDTIRNLEIGYIFQDYKLIDNLSVFDNVALVLTMIGIKDKKEIKKRVEYVLNKVGMLRFQKRPAGMLSGGERQRVGIARAIVKDPSIILADEPTGNLDSKNSLEVMKIIKAISKDRLVILVTHEQNLAKFYASRIIEIKDGKVINDYLNEHNDDLDYEIDNRFYLKDFKEQLKTNEGITIYSNEAPKLDIDIVMKNGNIYIQSKNKKIEVVDENSSIEFVNGHYKKIAKADIDKYDFDFKNIINNNYKRKYSSILNPITLIIKGFQKVFNFPFLKKILLGGFFLSAIFIMYAVSSIGASLQVNEEKFVSKNKEYLSVISKKNKVDAYLNYKNQESVNYIIPGNSIVNFNVEYKDFYQTSKNIDQLKGSLSSLELIQQDHLIFGRMPEHDYEIVIDRLTIKNMYESNDNLAQMAGLNDIEDMLNRKVTIKNMEDFTIVGIVDQKSPSIYVNKNLMINIISNSVDEEQSETNIIDYTLYQNDYVLKEGRLPEQDYEVIVNIINKESMPLNKTIKTEINGHKLTVVGYYTSKNNYDYYFVNNRTVEYNLVATKGNLTIYPNNKENCLNEFRSLNLNIEDSYTQSKREYLKENQENLKNSIFVASVILIISLIEMFLMMRSSFLSRIKEVGIYRAIGVKKSDIYRMFMGEIIAITTLASLPGLIIMAYILKTLSTIKYLDGLFLINSTVLIISIILVYGFNLLVGLLPVFNTIRKTPAQILSRHDLD